MRSAAACLLLVACSFTPGVLSNGTSGDDGDGDGGPGVDARPKPAAGPCGKPGALADDFADNTASPLWAIARGADVVESGGTLAITPAAAEVSGYRSEAEVDLRDAATEVE